MSAIRNYNEVNHEQLKDVLRVAYEKKVPTFVWGTMGIGKSAVVKEIAKELNVNFIDVRISQLEPSDLRGLPRLNGVVTEWLPPSWLPKQNNEKNNKGILFFDELNLAPPSIQASCYQLILDRRLGDYILPDGWVIISAGNRIEDKASVFEMPSPLANRFIHIELAVPEVEEWQEWAMEHKIDSRIITFLNWKKMRIHMFDAKNKDKSFPTPRMWEYANTLINDIDYNKHHQLFLTLLTSSVGMATAIEMDAFLKLNNKINAEDLLKNPKKVKTIEDISLKYSLISSITDYYTRNKSKETLSAICDVIKELDVEFGVLLLRLTKACDNDFFLKEIKSIKTYNKLAEDILKYTL